MAVKVLDFNRSQLSVCVGKTPNGIFHTSRVVWNRMERELDCDGRGRGLPTGGENMTVSNS